MTFSIVVPIYNSAHFLEECLDSVLGQTYSEWELLCINDGSEDASVGIVDMYVIKDKRVRYYSQSHQGLGVARNTGIEKARGDYVLFLDSDDILSSEALFVLYNKLREKAFLVDVIKYNAQIWDAGNNRCEDHYYNSDSERGYLSGSKFLRFFVQDHGWGPAGCFYCIRRSLFITGSVRYRAGIYFEDDLFVPLMLLHCQKAVIEITDNLYFYRVNPDSIMHSISRKHVYDRLLVAEVLENELSAYDIDRYTLDSIVYNEAMLGLQAFKWLYGGILWKGWLLAFRHASWKRKIKLLLLFFR